MTTPSRVTYLGTLAVTVATLLAACGTSWHRMEEPLTGQPEPGQVMQLWVRGEGMRYDHIQVVGDSLTARLRASDEFCRYSGCDRRFALAEIDSMRTGTFSAGGTARNVGLGFVFLGILSIAAGGFDYGP